MPRLTRDELQALVVETVRSNPGITHQGLIDALQSGGNYEAVQEIPNVSKAGSIVGEVVAQPDAAPALVYRLPG